jgi:hypothetical protein
MEIATRVANNARHPGVWDRAPGERERYGEASDNGDEDAAHDRIVRRSRSPPLTLRIPLSSRYITSARLPGFEPPRGWGISGGESLWAALSIRVVTSFDSDTDLNADLAFRMLSNSPVTLFHRMSVLQDTVIWLETNGYEVVTFDCREWGLEAMHDDIARILSFPDYYGRNFDALNDCLRDVVDGEYGWDPTATGLALVFIGYNRFSHAHQPDAHGVLDILARQSRDASLIGRRLLCLVQTDDPRLSFEQVGALPVWWNEREWLTSARTKPAE